MSKKTIKINKDNIKVIDLFCGIGGLTHGFVKEGFNVVAGIDSDGSCQYGYETNNDAIFMEKDIREVEAKELEKLYKGAKLKILVGCAPCQPYSGINTKRISKKTRVHSAHGPIDKFAELVEKIQPEIVSMENVRGLVKYPIFKRFLKTLEQNKYNVSYEIVNTSDYGVPQNRYRLVLLASKLGEIKLIKKTHIESKVTVKDAIGDLPPLKDGQTSKKDSYHRARKLSPINLKRIKTTKKNGGSAKEWPEHLLPECYKRESGKTYYGTVYGRMNFNEPSPTMTTQCTGLGNGRYGHPTQNRAITPREAARFQTFPDSYDFFDFKNEKFNIGLVSKYIGNAVPVQLGQIIAQSITQHLLK